MFERYLTDALTNQFGHLVEGLDADKIRLSTWKGELILKDLALRRNALDHWWPDAPLEICYGRVGNLEIRIPWKLIRSQLMWKSEGPTEAGLQSSLILTDVRIIVTPRRRIVKNSPVDGEEKAGDHDGNASSSSPVSKEERRLHKERLVRDLLDAQLLQRVAESSRTRRKKNPSQRWQWIQERVAGILTKLSVTIRNIHIRYEDPGTSMGFVWTINNSSFPTSPRSGRYRPPFAVGLTLSEFAIRSDEPDEESGAAVDKTSGKSGVRKRTAAAQALAVYWDSDCRTISDVLPLDANRENFERGLALLNHGTLPMLFPHETSKYQARHSFVLDPFSPTINLAMASPMVAKEGEPNQPSVPSSNIEASLPPCRFTLSRNLLEDVGYLRKSFAVWSRARKANFPEAKLRKLASLRPRQSPLLDPRGWWIFAFEAVMALQGPDSDLNVNRPPRQRGWHAVAKAVGRRRKYCELYAKLIYSGSTQEKVGAHAELLLLEEELQVSEIVAFRLAVYSYLREDQSTRAKVKNSARWGLSMGTRWSRTASKVEDSGYPGEMGRPDVMTLESRVQSYSEMAQIMDSTITALELVSSEMEQSNFMNRRGALAETNVPQTPIWNVSLSCPEISLQVNDRHLRSGRQVDGRDAVVKLSSGLALQHQLCTDGSWEVVLRVGSLVVRDCTKDLLHASCPPIFPNLVGPKGGSAPNSDHDTMYLHGVPYHQSIWLRIRRCPCLGPNGNHGSITWTDVKVLPLEVVYSTVAFESLSRILKAVNLELADDYHRLSARLSSWRERQQKRLLQALAHKEKIIHVNIDIGAPVFILNEFNGPQGSLLVVDLGKLRFANEESDNPMEYFDDHWRMDLNNIQVTYTNIRNFSLLRQASRDESSRTSSLAPEPAKVHQLVEPFSVSILISTKIQADDNQLSNEQTTVQVLATLPRLVLNLNASAVRLVRRLRNEWNKRKMELRVLVWPEFGSDRVFMPSTTTSSTPANTGEPLISNRKLEFTFTAPFLGVKLENDVDGRDCSVELGVPTTRIAELVLRGVEGCYISEKTAVGTARISAKAKLRSLQAIDYYQGAGSEFSYLLSSLPPERALGRTESDLSRPLERHLSGTDLVVIDYESTLAGRHLLAAPGVKTTSLSINFHELYVEWNPETFAAIQKAMKLPIVPDTNASEKSTDEDDFYDAEEEDFYDAESTTSQEDVSQSISEIESSRVSSFSDLRTSESGVRLTWPGFQVQHARLLSPPGSVASNQQLRSRSRDASYFPSAAQSNGKDPVTISFQLSKLRVNFNKESRHRRLLTAEMDGTSVRYSTQVGGGSRTVASIGNLTFADSESVNNATLYREIIGLKTDARSGLQKPSSLLEMEVCINPRRRQYVTGELFREEGQESNGCVTIDTEEGAVYGFDTSVRARFSPMRFVYLQQLTNEIADYFFEGVLGYEVWGGVRPSRLALADLEKASIGADQISFTLFHVEIESPIFLFPVTYCSTDFIRLEASKITFSNFYNIRPMRRLDGDGFSCDQWYNNCTIKLDSFKLTSWAGHELLDQGARVGATVQLNWPTGPKAILNVPKWKVSCEFDPLRLSLRKEDYGLLLSVIQQNIGEPSRNLDEWHALQSLPPLVLARYKEDIMVHYGYDKKDVTPTTFDMTIAVPELAFSLSGNVDRIATLRFLDLGWNYKKHSDLIGRQMVSCNLEVLGPIDNADAILLSTRESPNLRHGLSYMSKTLPSGNNERSLELVETKIHLKISVWKEVASYFQNLPTPNYTSPDEVIQVGDRWYRIGENSRPPVTGKSSKLAWITKIQPPTITSGVSTQNTKELVFRFSVHFKRLEVWLGTDLPRIVVKVDDVHYDREVKGVNVDIQLMSKGIEMRKELSPSMLEEEAAPLIRPWSFSCKQTRCLASRCSCDIHSTRIEVDHLHLKASYTDMTTCIRVALELVGDMRARGVRSEPRQRTSKLVNGEQKPSPSLLSPPPPSGPPRSVMNVILIGFTFAVVDDSGRQFAGTQDLVELSFGHVYVTTEEMQRQNPPLNWPPQSSSYVERKILCRVGSITLIDCLQSQLSPFREVFAVRSSHGKIGLDQDGQPDMVALSLHPNSKRSEGFVGDGRDVALEVSAVEATSKSFDARLHALIIQYNPSMIIALQRFLGRIKKEATAQYQGFNRALLPIPSSATDAAEGKSQMWRACFHVESAVLRLNKEHLGRRLLELSLSRVQLDCEHESEVFRLSGALGDLNAAGPGSEASPNRLFSTSNCRDTLLQFRYWSFREGCFVSTASEGFPSWVGRGLGTSQPIDTCLHVSVNSFEILLISSFVSELLDYVRNGMPGKRMGSSAPRAKGNSVISRNFLNVQLTTSKITFPNTDTALSGIILTSGDLEYRSWIDDMSTHKRQSITMSDTSMSTRVVGSLRDHDNMVLLPMNISLDVDSDDAARSVMCRVSDITVRLAFTDYLLIRSVIKWNFDRSKDEKNWNNLEVPWNFDNERAVGVDFSREIDYSPSARLIQYGISVQPNQIGSISSSYRFSVENISLLLKRDGEAANIELEAEHDLIHLIVQSFNMSFDLKGADSSFSVILAKVFVFDLGEPRRSFRRASDELSWTKRRTDRVLIEGYSPPEKANSDGSSTESHILVKVERDMNNHTRIIIVVSYLSVAALLGPLHELKCFFAGSWSNESVPSTPVEVESKTKSSEGALAKSTSGRIDVRVVMHYPRLIFVADEAKQSSKGLVLRGLAIANISLKESGDIASRGDENTASSQMEITADFQNISSYIQTDVSDVLMLRPRHRPHLREIVRGTTILESVEDEDDPREDLGVPLLLPLTIAVEFQQTKDNDSVRRRSFALNIDPVSLTFSSEDLRLVNELAKKWTTRRMQLPPETKLKSFDREFRAERLGLGLRKDRGKIVVDNVSGNALDLGIETGDELCSIDGIELAVSRDLSLSAVVSQLATKPRPLTLSFTRVVEKAKTEGSNSFFVLGENDSQMGIDSIDLSLSTANLTLVERDVPVLRALLTSSKASGRREQAECVSLKCSLSSSLQVDCFNFRIWSWEPLVEGGGFSLSGDLQSPSLGPRELALEVSDRPGGFALNLTDSAAETLGKIIEWSNAANENKRVDSTVLSEEFHLPALEGEDGRPGEYNNTAHVALTIAHRQKNGMSKPFIFKNRTGLSVAFVKQNGLFRKSDGKSTFVALGDYYGLGEYDNTDVKIVGSGEEANFKVDLQLFARSDSSFADLDSSKDRHLLSVAFQEICGVRVLPLRDLQILRPEQTVLPLTVSSHTDTNEATAVNSFRHRVVWVVEQKEEKSLLTIGSSIRVQSMLSDPVEIGVRMGQDDLVPKHIGIVRGGESFYLPLWLAVQQDEWQCSVRPLHGFQFTPLFDCSPEGWVDFGENSVKSLYCAPVQSDEFGVWLGASEQLNNSVTTIILDCAILIRNLLPTRLQWELFEGSSTTSSSTTIDAGAFTEALDSGGNAEVLTNLFATSKARFRPGLDLQWSTWIALSLSNANEEESALHYVKAPDEFGLHQVLGVRIAKKTLGLEVTLFTDLWCSNRTGLPLTFGCPREQISELQSDEYDDERPPELSAAEAALKEISSLFEAGEEGTGRRQDMKRMHLETLRLSGQASPIVVEECFEYIEVESSTVKRRWWASEDPFCSREDATKVFDHGVGWRWIDKAWKLDCFGQTMDGWETSSNLLDFSNERAFVPIHRYRRRRWVRCRHGVSKDSLVEGIHAYHHPFYPSIGAEDTKSERAGLKIGLQVNGGMWALTSNIPRAGKVYGAVRVAESRWPKTVRQTKGSEGGIFELSFAISPLEGDWGEFSRLMVVSSRFLLRNESSTLVFEVKQTGTSDEMAVRISPGEAAPFHWADFRLPELISVRPLIKVEGRSIYKWSGGFDPVTIGPVPLRIRQVRRFSNAALTPESDRQSQVRSIKMESEIRPRTGRTGINISFHEEDNTGDGALFKIENRSPFPVWFAQDGILANPIGGNKDDGEGDGDVLGPAESTCFALDVPFRQGKYSGRKAASMAELLRLRLGLAPLASRSGIETTKVVSLANVGDRVRLNPIKLLFLSPDLKATIPNIRVLGIVDNDGPTRVLRLRLMEKDLSDRILYNPFSEDSSFGIADPYALIRELPPFAREIVDGAISASKLRAEDSLPSEEAIVCGTFNDAWKHEEEKYISLQIDEPTNAGLLEERDLLVSFRFAVSLFVISLVDAGPSEIAVLTLRNVNAIATWNILRSIDATMYFTVTDLQVDNMVPNSPFPVAVCPDEPRVGSTSLVNDTYTSDEVSAPLLVVGLSFAPRHKSRILCLKSVTVAPKNLAIRVDLAFLVRLQKFALGLQSHLNTHSNGRLDHLPEPDIASQAKRLEAAVASSRVRSQKFYFGVLTILPCNIRLSVAPARALTSPQAALEGAENAAIHQAVRKGDVRLDRNSAALLGVKVGGRNTTPLAVVRGVFKSIVVDALLRLDGASLNFAGVSLRNHVSTGSQLSTHLSAHYLAALRQNVPALLGSLAALGNPLGLVRGLGDGVSDFVLEPVKGFQRSVQEMDASHLVDGVARGTLSLARHTVGSFADSAAMLTETFSKNMAVLTLDRRYAQRRDRGDILRGQGGVNVAVGIGSGVQKLVTGFLEGVTGVVKAPIRGAEKRGLEGFAKGIGKGLLGLLVKPIIGISDGITEVMIGVKGSFGGSFGPYGGQIIQVRPRRPVYGRERSIRAYDVSDAAAAALMMRTRLAGEAYLGYLDMGDRLALLSVKRIAVLDSTGEERLVLKYKHIESLEVRVVEQDDGTVGWSIVTLLNTPRKNGSEVEVINCNTNEQASELCAKIQLGLRQSTLEHGETSLASSV